MCTWQACNEEVFSLGSSRMVASQYIVGLCTIYEAMSCHVTHISDSTYISIILSVFVLQRQQDRKANAGPPSTVQCPSVRYVLVVVVVWKLDNDLWGVKSNFILISFHFQPPPELRRPPSASSCFKVENERHMRHVKYENKSQSRRIESFGTFDGRCSKNVLWIYGTPLVKKKF